MVPSDAPSWALLSVLGVPGWGPLHLLLKQGADPGQIALRLRQSLAHADLPLSGCDVPGGRLLAALLHSQLDLDPVAAPGDGAVLADLRYRHRLVWRPADGLIMRSWERHGAAGSGARDSDGWHPLGPGRRLVDFLQSPHGQPEASPPRSGVR